MSKELEKRLLEAGKALLLLPSSVDTLLHLLDKLFICLVEVEQSPPSSIQEALSPLKKALVDERLFKHWNVHVRVHVASCFIQVTRINAPTAPYVDEQMREVLKLIVSSFEHLDDKSSLSYTKSTSILNTVAKYDVSYLMLDPVYDALCIEMFQHFLKALRDDHPVEVFSDMENIMTHVLKESDDLPPKLLAPILHYVNETDEVPSISRRLAEKVLLNCSTKCQTYLAEAVKSSGVSLDKYSNVVAFICEGASSDKPKKQDDDEPQQLDSNAINSGLDEETGRAVNQKKKESSMEAKPSAATASASQEIGTAQAKLTKESGKKIASASNAKPSVPPTKRSTSEIKATKQSERPISLGDNKKTIVSSGKSVSKSKTEVKQQPSEKTLANTNAKRKHSLDTEKAFDDRKYDKTLVGSRIRVWWPLDKMYYRGEVTSYDPSRKRHMVVYEDGDQETLDLKNHNWYLVEASKSSKHKDKQKAAEVSNREQTGAPKRRLNLSLPPDEDPAEAETQARKRARVQSHSLHKSHGEMEKPTAEGEPSCHHRKSGSELGHSQTCSITHQLGKVKQSITDTITSVRKFGSEVETKEQTIVDMLTSVRQFGSQLETKEQSIVDMLASVKQFRSELETKEQRIVDTLNSVQQFRSEIKKKEDNLVASLHEVDVLGEKISGINKILNS
ncbi:hypothetical protein HID58_094018 [Brassica napus]|uniref:PTM/DIR17-like Tudor domain-containing protein n=1 Tax=Brassica napus TaxID=3708 RepID=A0ABQ7X2F3_BRANA|nr:hypothetical protein HID58_096290 [Brassica napus]KAH0852422.1 hypothetical protein HID58_094018 [Brassica napus]